MYFIVASWKGLVPSETNGRPPDRHSQPEDVPAARVDPAVDELQPRALERLGALAVLDVHPVAELGDEVVPREAEPALELAGAELRAHALQVRGGEEELGRRPGQLAAGAAAELLPVRRADDRGMAQPVACRAVHGLAHGAVAGHVDEDQRLAAVRERAE